MKSQFQLCELVVHEIKPPGNIWLVLKSFMNMITQILLFFNCFCQEKPVLFEIRRM